VNRKITDPASQPTPSTIEESNSFSQYLSFHFRENLDHLAGITKDSINDFLKTISEIEDEFVAIVKGQQSQLQSFELDHSGPYMEENY
jgi:hypothetical protein